MPSASDDPGDEVTPEDAVVEPLDYERFFSEHCNRLMGFARRSADNAQQGDDAFQQAMIDAYRRWAEVSAMDRPWAWTIRVIRHKLYRLRQRREDPSPAADGAVEDSSEKTALWDAVSKLPPRQREIVTMRFELDLDVEEIAVVLDIKESTVRSALSRAIRRLKDTLAGEEDDR